MCAMNQNYLQETLPQHDYFQAYYFKQISFSDDLMVFQLYHCGDDYYVNN